MQIILSRLKVSLLFFILLSLLQQKSVFAQSPIVNPVVNPGDRQDSVDFYQSQYKMANAATGWTGNLADCESGSTSPEFRTAVLQRINYFRAMAGIPLLNDLYDLYTTKSQDAALITSANRTINHSPSNSANCYTDVGAEGANNSNLAMGIWGWNAINAYMREPGSTNYTAGHRRWLLFPQTKQMGTGDVPVASTVTAANALWVFDVNNMNSTRPQTRHEFVAWPPPGFVPYKVVYPRWSFSYAGADFNSASVVMSLNGASVSVRKEAIVNGYGENTIVWSPLSLNNAAEWPRPVAGVDMVYTIEINNLLINGVSRNFTYNVTVIDVNEPPTDLRLSASTVYENRAISTTVGTLATTDADSGEKHIYTLVDGEGSDDNASVVIVGRYLKTLSRFDFESKSKLSVRLRVSDGRPNGSYEKAFTITVKNQNDAPTNAALNPAIVAENMPAKTVVGVFSTMDQDISNTFRYMLSPSFGGGTDNGKFIISGNQLKTLAIFDYETKDSYLLRVQARDSAGGYITKYFTVTVQNVEESLAQQTTGVLMDGIRQTEEIYTGPVLGEERNDGVVIEELSVPVESEAYIYSGSNESTAEVQLGQPPVLKLETPEQTVPVEQPTEATVTVKLFLPVVTR